MVKIKYKLFNKNITVLKVKGTEMELLMDLSRLVDGLHKKGISKSKINSAVKAGLMSHEEMLKDLEESLDHLKDLLDMKDKDLKMSDILKRRDEE